ncbi:ABC transporter ATP-binding protein [Vibrio hippocampi]|uniref:ABC transporter ATP-binding protein n=1 Tax=Vibrio hippocampi TaxID=654686 RepID=A0ABN8DCL5_9VIBR|nr:ABC transporter ATP-binding protein [Vibrio hippocampi]CAH0524528.1 putative ABC transporter ATP-binding protein [Vibrio hippocampi]
MAPIITLSNATFRWKADQAPTLDIPSLNIEQGQHLFLKGPSGCGKSTLLSLITGINTVSSGSLSALGQELNALSASQRDRFRADHVGYIFQQFNLLPYLSVIDNVTLPCRFSPKRKSKVQGSLDQEAKLLLDQLRLPKSLINKPVVELSIGQQQRVAAARALIGQPELLIADEPTSALDHDNREAFISLLMEQANQANSTLVFVSHDPTLESLFTRSENLMDINQVSGS